MFGSLISYAASRAAGDAVDNLLRRAVFILAALLFVSIGIAFLTVALYWSLKPEIGAIPAAGALAAGAFLLGLIALAIPKIQDWYAQRTSAAKQIDAEAVASDAVDAVHQETEAAVDYFGALQVVASAFAFGIGAGRKLRRS